MTKITMEEIMLQKDYKMSYEFGRCHCGLMTNIYLHRTQSEINAGKDNNIKRICSDRHITIPRKFCTGCNKEYPLDQLSCGPCYNKLVERVTNDLS